MSPILKVKGLNVILDGRVIVEDINFEISAGQFLSVVGPNGSGKTVLLKTLLGLLSYQGKIEWRDGVRIGYVPQKVDADIHLPLNLMNLLKAKAKILKLANTAIGSVSGKTGLTKEILKTPIGHLSGGQFQKALIALALLGEPQVVLFDEPTASLDQLAEEHVDELMGRLREKGKLTAILVSHDLQIISRYADLVLCLNKKSFCFGPPQDTLKPEILSELYGSPVKYHGHRH